MDAKDSSAATTPDTTSPQPTPQQTKWLRRGLVQPGGKLPLFDEHGQRVSARTVESCLRHGWAAPWFENPLKPDWQICKLTDAGRAMVEGIDDDAGRGGNVYQLHA